MLEDPDHDDIIFVTEYSARVRLDEPQSQSCHRAEIIAAPAESSTLSAFGLRPNLQAIATAIFAATGSLFAVCQQHWL